MKKTLSVILPTFNEKENIVPLIELIRRVANPFEVIVVDDNSSDGTKELLHKKYPHQPDIKIIINNPRLGLTPSLQKGIDCASGEYIAWMDADFSHPPQLLLTMLTEINKYDIIVGSWLSFGGHDFRKEKTHKVFSYLLNFLCRIIFGNKIHTFTSGYILTKKNILNKIRLKGNYGEYCIDFLVRAVRLGKSVYEVPFDCYSRKNGQTKTAPNIRQFIKNGSGYLWTILRLCVSGGT